MGYTIHCIEKIIFIIRKNNVLHQYIQLIRIVVLVYNIQSQALNWLRFMNCHHVHFGINVMDGKLTTSPSENGNEQQMYDDVFIYLQKQKYRKDVSKDYKRVVRRRAESFILRDRRVTAKKRVKSIIGSQLIS